MRQCLEITKNRIRKNKVSNRRVGKNWQIGKLARAWQKARCEYGGCWVVMVNRVI